MREARNVNNLLINIQYIILKEDYYNKGIPFKSRGSGAIQGEITLIIIKLTSDHPTISTRAPLSLHHFK